MLTDTQIKAAMKAVQTEITLTDRSGSRGGGSLKLVIRRLSDGSVSAQWFAMSKRNGARQKRKLGTYPDVTLSMARQRMTAEIAPALRAGKSLRVAARPSELPTVERLFAGYVGALRDRGRASADEIERVLLKVDGCAADFLGRDRLAGDIEPADVAEYLAEFYRRGRRGAADHARSYLSAAFGWGLKATHDYTVERRTDWGIRANPVAAVPRDAGAMQPRDRALSAEEIRDLWAATDLREPDGFAFETAACIRLLLTCGQRVQETLRVEGRDIDLDAALWTMPAPKTKGRKRPHVIPLPPQAVDTFRALVERHGDGWLFPTKEGSKGAIMEHQTLNRAIRRWTDCDDVDVGRFQTRDLRRTWKTRTADAGIDRFTRDLIQQHAQGDTGSRHYDRADYLPLMRAAMERWGHWLDAAIIGRPFTLPVSNVIPFPVVGVAAVGG